MSASPVGQEFQHGGQNNRDSTNYEYLEYIKYHDYPHHRPSNYYQC